MRNPHAERDRAGELTEIACLLQQADRGRNGSRARRGLWCGCIQGARAVQESNLTVQIAGLRRALGEVAGAQMRFSSLVSPDVKAFHRSIPAGSEQERIEA